MNVQNNPRRSMRYTGIFITAALCFIIALVGCGMDDMATSDGDEFENEGEPGNAASGLGEIQQAEAALKDHRIDDAHAIYGEMLNRDSHHGTAAAGLAITEILLLLEMHEVTELFIENLGASRGIDANELIYAKGGYLYWASRGARWADDGQYEGIRSILADDLPWTEDQLRSFAAFVDGLDEPMEKVIRQLVSVANVPLRGIDINLEVALADDDFTRLYVPGQVFHDSELTLRLGRSELATLRSLIAFVRSAIYFLAAYEHDWNLEKAFGTWRFDVPLDDADYVSGYTPVDYTVDYLDRHLLREVVNPDRLSASRSALRDSLSHARSAIRHGLEEPYSTTLQWDDVHVDDAYEFDALLRIVAESLQGPVDVPYAEPHGMTLDLSPLFDDQGYSLDESIPWFVRNDDLAQLDPDGDLQDMSDLWDVNEEALDIFLFDKIIDIPGTENEVTIAVGPNAKSPSGFVEILFGAYLDAVEDVYLSTR